MRESASRLLTDLATSNLHQPDTSPLHPPHSWGDWNGFTGPQPKKEEHNMAKQSKTTSEKVTFPNATYIREITMRYDSTNVRASTIRTNNDIVAFLRSVTYDNTKEHFFGVFLNGAHHIIGFQCISIGTANQAQVHPREVFQPAIVAGSVSLILAHNHPSGSLVASSEDHAMTKRLKEAGELLGVRVLDHIIFTDSDHLSLIPN